MSFVVEPGTLAIAKAHSSNSKIGDAATTYVEQRSCPSSCVFKDGGGCYAEDGPLGKFLTGPLNRAAAMFVNATPEEIAQAEADAIDRMEVVAERPMRLHTVGDCATDAAAKIVSMACLRYRYRGGGPVWTYTHAWREVARESWAGISVFASCETPEDVALARERGYATAIVVEEFPTDRRYELAAQPHLGQVGQRPGSGNAPVTSVPIIPCPAQTRHVACTDCRLCFDDGARRKAGVTIGFSIHGVPVAVRRAKLALNAPDDPDRKLSSRVLIPRFEREFEEEHGRLPSDAEVARALGMSPSSVWEMRRSLKLGGPARPARRGRRSRG